MLKRLYVYILLLLPLATACNMHSATQQNSDKGHLHPIYTTADSLAVRKIGALALSIYQQYPDSSLALFRQSLQYSQRVGYQYGIYIAWSNTTFILYSQGRREEALEAYKSMIINCDTSVVKERQRLAAALNDMGNLCADMAQYRQALEYYHMAAKAYVKYGSDIYTDARVLDLSLIYNNIASVFINLSEYKQTLPYLDTAEKEAQKKKNYPTLCSIYSNMGESMTGEKKYAEGEAFLLKAVGIAHQYIPGTHEETMSLTMLGLFYNETGQPVKAIPYLQQALAMTSDQEKAVVLSALGDSWRRLKNVNKSISYFTLGEKEVKQSGDINTLVDIYSNLNDLYNDRHDYKEAYVYLKKYTTLKDSIRSKSVADNINRLDVEYRTAQKDEQLAKNHLLLEKSDKQYWKLVAGATTTVLIVVIILIIVVIAARRRQRMNRQKITAMEQEKIAVEQKRIALEQEMQIKSLRDTISGEELERKRIAQELHDGIGGMLIGVRSGIDTFQEKHREYTELNNIMERLKEISDEVRKTAHNLMPGILDRLGLAGTLDYYLVQEGSAKEQLKIDLQIYGPVDDTPRSFQLVVYRIVQQLVHNVVQHARATHILVQLNSEEEDNTFTILVEDNGRGFDMDRQQKGIGLQSITDRVQSMRGLLNIRSSREEGTLVTIEFSLSYIKTITA